MINLKRILFKVFLNFIKLYMIIPVYTEVLISRIYVQ